MRTLSNFAVGDGMSQQLLRMTVTSAVYCLSEMTSPWGFQVAKRDIPAFHLLTSGTAWLEVEGENSGARLNSGDLIILPHGDAHRLKDAKDSRILWLDDILAATPPIGGRLRYGGGGDFSDLICGGFAIDLLAARALLDAMPRVIHLKGHAGKAPEWLSGLIRMIAVEMASNSPGADAIVTRLTDALLAQALRAYLLQSDQVAAPPARDAQVARALRLMRERPEEHWSVPTLAAAVGLSRSAFAHRFRQATGETPMQSLTRYRLSRAATYLRSSDAGVQEIARRTGYESEVSISKAFRRVYGTSPGAYRKSLGAA